MGGEGPLILTKPMTGSLSAAARARNPATCWPSGRWSGHLLPANGLSMVPGSRLGYRLRAANERGGSLWRPAIGRATGRRFVSLGCVSLRFGRPIDRCNFDLRTKSESEIGRSARATGRRLACFRWPNPFGSGRVGRLRAAARNKWPDTLERAGRICGPRGCAERLETPAEWLLASLLFVQFAEEVIERPNLRCGSRRRLWRWRNKWKWKPPTARRSGARPELVS